MLKCANHLFRSLLYAPNDMTGVDSILDVLLQLHPFLCARAVL